MSEARASKACESVEEKLTAYLDGELAGDAGTVVRGHLRTCASCRDLAEREAALRDGLRDLPTVDPPSALWAGVQARLAAAEVAEAERPAWRRFLSRLAPSRWMPAPTTVAAGALVVAAAITLVLWRSQRDATDHELTAIRMNVTDVKPGAEKVPTKTDLPQTIALGCRVPAPPPSGDVTDDLALDAARLSATYCQSTEDVLRESAELRAKWQPDEIQAFEKRIGELLAQAQRADEGPPRQRAMRLLLNFVRKTVANTNVAFASGAP
ncbi:MAG: zf-HC2 domain-containing protein [Deltaproteobacteria bacterium]|nr:zf-HC2 domain-containing protein [Deltaproteobacteria bacterium]MCW5807467.1 zf-HC2 domain-containing protein [Deltaproteobacteria bacterium]